MRPIRARSQLPSHDEANKEEDNHVSNLIIPEEGDIHNDVSATTHDESIMMPGQVFRDTSPGSSGSNTETYQNWIQTHAGFFVHRSEAMPYTPTYRVVADTHTDSDGVTPYVIPRTSSSQDDHNHQDLPEQCVLLPKELADQQRYDPDSPLCRKDLKQPVGTTFSQPSLLVVDVSKEDDKGHPVVSVLNDNKVNWWTCDGQTWWPTTKPTKIPMTNMNVPQECFPTMISKTPVTEWATPQVNVSSVHQMIHKGNNWVTGYHVIAALIVLEHLMIIGGATWGVERGWTMGLQGTYFLGLLILSCAELTSVCWLIPNGRLWLILNNKKLLLTALNGLLYKWDLYGDVGFAILAYENRDLRLETFWYVPVILTSVFVLVRLAACLYSLGKMTDLSETSLSRLFVPSYLSIFGLLIENLHVGDLHGVLVGTQTDILFQLFRIFLQDTPELVFQTVYLAEPDASVTCLDCASGFVFLSILSSFFALSMALYHAKTCYASYQTTQAKLGSTSKITGAARDGTGRESITHSQLEVTETSSP